MVDCNKSPPSTDMWNGRLVHLSIWLAPLLTRRDKTKCLMLLFRLTILYYLVFVWEKGGSVRSLYHFGRTTICPLTALFSYPNSVISRSHCHLAPHICDCITINAGPRRPRPSGCRVASPRLASLFRLSSTAFLYFLSFPCFHQIFIASWHKIITDNME
ncbi:hypothetical protein V8C37DRAFT_204797 [Trichoderma ceciliae]